MNEAAASGAGNSAVAVDEAEVEALVRTHSHSYLFRACSVAIVDLCVLERIVCMRGNSVTDVRCAELSCVVYLYCR